MNNPSIGIIGGGSWATAIIKIITENLDSINWWIRDKKIINHIQKHGNNPNYMSSIKLDRSKLNLTSNINKVIEMSDYLVLAIPSAFLHSTLKSVNNPMSNKFIFSAIKGIVPEKNAIVGEYIHNNFNVPYKNIGIITGPCHAEEVGLEKLSYLTVACTDLKKARFFADLISCKYINSTISDDIYGTEYASVLKNIIAIASGISHGIGYGDNFQSVLVSNAIREIERFVDAVHPIDRDIKESAYLGDLLVTSYSQFSRNRAFGEMIGKGNSINSAKLKLKMIAEGYYAVKCISEINTRLNVDMPITEAVYSILYDKKSAKKQIDVLAEKLN